MRHQMRASGRPLIGVLHAAVLATICAIAPGLPFAADTQRHDREFWRGIAAAEYAVPEGESPIALVHELIGMLGSRDAEERDTFGYTITARWIYGKEIFSAGELRELLSILESNLGDGLGEIGTDSVLKRSFSALNLSVLAAYDNKAPFLEEKEIRRLLDDALAYFKGERDVRGYLPGVGWMHSVAHTSDLLKFLGRNRHLDAAGCRRILDAIASKQAAPDGGVYQWGEDERMARAVLSIVRRGDFDVASFGGWLDGLASRAHGLWEGDLDTARFAEVQNIKNLLRSLFVILHAEAVGDGEPGPVGEARGLILAALGKL